MKSQETLAQASQEAQRQGHSVQAHSLMAEAYALALTRAQHSQQVSDWDCAARLFSHQLLLHWSFASHAELTAQLQHYYQTHVAPLTRHYSQQQLSLSQRAPGPLRLAFLSPDLRHCSAANLIADLFSHTPSNLELFVLSTAPPDAKDPIQTALKDYMVTTRHAHWHDLSQWHSADIAEQIKAWQIDLLLDLAGHTSLSGLQVMARQPAPLQITGLTFNGGVGLSDRCLRVTDRICTPHSGFYPQDLPLFLSTWISSDAAGTQRKEQSPSLAHTPSKNSLKLGCAHHPGRLSDHCLQTWGRLLAQLPPHSQLHLKHACYSDRTSQQRILEQLLPYGLTPAQIVFETASDYPDYLTFYDRLDLALDPFPYHGGLVSCDTLWRGVPLVTLSSYMHGGASLLHQLQAPEGIAQNPDDYIKKALGLLNDVAGRQALRTHLPQGMAQCMAGQPHRWVKQLFSALETYIVP